ncbi:MAG: hypothetical protein H6742_17210 [Alphaproteobacteria bacterium]|nr:hypothetical protein [Alphaproteobacteria bacterium]
MVAFDAEALGVDAFDGLREDQDHKSAFFVYDDSGTLLLAHPTDADPGRPATLAPVPIDVGALQWRASADPSAPRRHPSPGFRCWCCSAA